MLSQHVLTGAERAGGAGAKGVVNGIATVAAPSGRGVLITRPLPIHSGPALELVIPTRVVSAQTSALLSSKGCTDVRSVCLHVGVEMF